MSVPTAKEMASNLFGMAKLLHDQSLIDHEALYAVQAVAQRLRKFKNQTSWEYNIAREFPIRFAFCFDSKLNEKFQPTISIEKIKVGIEDDMPAFYEWNAVLLLQYSNQETPDSRWHIDWANDQQNSPLTHLQYGGRGIGPRLHDETLKEPRWNFMLMDTVLLMELVVADFFKEQWLEIRKNPLWYSYIKPSEKMCYLPFLKDMNSAISGPKSALSSMRTALFAE